MEIFAIKKDIEVICVTAGKFPDGILAAHQKLRAEIAKAPDREYFGLSWGSKNGIVYKAAASVLSQKELDLGLETYTIKKGAYIRELLPDYQNNIPQIKSTFDKLLTDPRIDPEGYCMEAFANEKDLWCMVKIRG